MALSIDQIAKQLGERLKQNVVIRDYVTTEVGGIVDYLTVCETIDELIEVVGLANRANLSFVVIGQGSSVLFSDVGFGGLVIINRTNRIASLIDRSRVIVDSGVMLSKLIMEVASRDLTGLEFLFGLRGTVGGATVTNRQANGVAFGNLVKGATLLMPDGKIVHHKGTWFDFEPFISRLLRCRQSDPSMRLPVILTVTLQLSQNKKEEILRKIQHLGMLNRQNWPLDQPSLAPMFREFSPDQSVTELLSSLDLRKMSLGRARILVKQPNAILTHERGLGAGRTADIEQLVYQLKSQVYETYQIRLEEAFEYLGGWPHLEHGASHLSQDSANVPDLVGSKPWSAPSEYIEYE